MHQIRLYKYEKMFDIGLYILNSANNSYYAILALSAQNVLQCVVVFVFSTHGNDTVFQIHHGAQQKSVQKSHWHRKQRVAKS